MPKKDKACKLCARVAPEKCKRHGGSPKKATGGGKKSAKKKPPVREPASANGHGRGDLKDNEARKAADVLLGHLYRLRDNLAVRIQNVEELAQAL